MSIQSQIDRLQSAKDGLKQVLFENGVSVPENATLDSFPVLFSGVGKTGSTYLYKCTFLVDQWNGSDNFSQTATVKPMLNAPEITTDFSMASSIFVEDDYEDSVFEIIKESGGVIDRGKKVVGNGTLECTTRSGEKPTSDVEIFFLAKSGGQ